MSRMHDDICCYRITLVSLLRALLNRFGTSNRQKKMSKMLRGVLSSHTTRSVGRVESGGFFFTSTGVESVRVSQEVLYYITGQ